jgi:sugar lactone lactonase YvrE
MKELKKLTGGLYFGEGPRWHENKLWFSDFYSHKVMTLDENNSLETVCKVPSQPSGLGWLPNGDLLIVSMLDRKILKFSEGSISVHADLSEYVAHKCNDMVVGRDGTAYVGNFGMGDAGESLNSTHLMIVKSDGTVLKGPDNLLFPNGTVITEDGKNLIIAETLGAKLTSFDIEDNGELTNRKLWARTSPLISLLIIKFLSSLGFDLSKVDFSKYSKNLHVPDGICLDEKNGIWIASPTTKAVVRIEKGGNITDTINTPKGAFACMLGGKERKTLYVIISNSSDPEEAQASPEGEIHSIEVEIPGVGKP